MLLSLAYQIACHIPRYRRELEDLVSSQELTRALLLKDYNVLSIFEEFLQIPLCAIQESEIPVARIADVNSPKNRAYRCVVLIDALDECDDEGKNEVLLCIQRHFLKLPKWIKVYLTTRPEIPIVEKLKKFSPTFIEPSQSENRSDLAIYFRHLLQQYGSEELKVFGPSKKLPLTCWSKRPVDSSSMLPI
jgi:hypothetical protein